MKNYLLKATVPSVQELIIQSRKLVDLFGGSSLLPTVIKKTLTELPKEYNIEFLIPSQDVLKDTGNNNITNVVYLKVQATENQIVKLGRDIENNFKIALKQTLDIKKHLAEIEVDKWIDLINYQIETALKIIWAAAEIKDSKLKQAKEEVDKAVAYLKSSTIPQIEYIEGYNLFTKEANLFYENDFEEFLKNQETCSYKHTVGAVLCSMCGKRTIIGATEDDPAGKKIWKKYYEKEGEKLCGFCFAKRRYHKQKFESVVDYALADYKAVDQVYKIINGYDIQDIYKENWENHENDKEFIERVKDLYKKYGKPSAYYGLIMADGDGMGQKVEDAFESEDKVKKFTTQMSEYAKKFSEAIKSHKGGVIYAGGDDILAICPRSTTLPAYMQIASLPKDFTISGGVVFAHYKVPLNYVLQTLRENEKKAKDFGKNGVYISYIKHSLSTSGCFVKNNHIQEFEELIQIVSSEDFPHTFIYQLESLLKPYGEKTKNIQQVKTLTKYLINKKKFQHRERFETLILESQMMMGGEEIYIPDIIGKLKVAKFIAGGSDAKD